MDLSGPAKDTCTLHQRKYRYGVLITIKALNIGANRTDPDQTAPNCVQSDQGLHCFAIPPVTGICNICNIIYHCNNKGCCMTTD